MKLDNFPKVLWINLDRCPDRFEKTQKLLDEHSLVHQRIRAIDGENLEELDKICLRRRCNDKVYACSCSHLSAIKYFIEKMTDDKIIVFEDDISFDYLNHIPFDWSVLESHFPKDYKIIQLAVGGAEDMTNTIVFSKNTDQAGTIAYLITRKAGIELLDKYYDKERDVFNLLWSKNIHGYIAADYILYSIGSVYTLPIFTYTGETSIIHEHHLKEHRHNKDLILKQWLTFKIRYPSLMEYFKKVQQVNNTDAKDTLVLSYSTEQKSRMLHVMMKESPIKFFVNKNALSYAANIVNMILKIFNKCTFVDQNSEYDLSVQHITDKIVNLQQNALNIIIAAEPWNSQHSFDLSIDGKLVSNAKQIIHYPFLFSSLREHKKSIDPKDYIREKTKFCAYMYHMEYEHRIKYFKLLSGYKQIDALGKCCNNVTITNTRYTYNDNQTYNDIAIDYYADYKFVLSVENAMVKGYSTEKLINPLIANSIPIYWGDAEIFKYVNKKRVIYILDFKTDEELIEYIRYVDTNDAVYNSIISESIYIDPDLTLDKMESNLNENIKSILDP